MSISAVSKVSNTYSIVKLNVVESLWVCGICSNFL